jgi:hypothetical protein
MDFYKFGQSKGCTLASFSYEKDKEACLAFCIKEHGVRSEEVEVFSEGFKEGWFSEKMEESCMEESCVEEEGLEWGAASETIVLTSSRNYAWRKKAWNTP